MGEGEQATTEVGPSPALPAPPLAEAVVEATSDAAAPAASDTHEGDQSPSTVQAELQPQRADEPATHPDDAMTDEQHPEPEAVSPAPPIDAEAEAPAAAVAAVTAPEAPREEEGEQKEGGPSNEAAVAHPPAETPALSDDLPQSVPAAVAVSEAPVAVAEVAHEEAPVAAAAVDTSLDAPGEAVVENGGSPSEPTEPAPSSPSGPSSEDAQPPLDCAPTPSSSSSQQDDPPPQLLPPAHAATPESDTLSPLEGGQALAAFLRRHEDAVALMFAGLCDRTRLDRLAAAAAARAVAAAAHVDLTGDEEEEEEDFPDVTSVPVGDFLAGLSRVGTERGAAAALGLSTPLGMLLPVGHLWRHGAPLAEGHGATSGGYEASSGLVISWHEYQAALAVLERGRPFTAASVAAGTAPPSTSGGGGSSSSALAPLSAATWVAPPSPSRTASTVFSLSPGRVLEGLGSSTRSMGAASPLHRAETGTAGTAASFRGSTGGGVVAGPLLFESGGLIRVGEAAPRHAATLLATGGGAAAAGSGVSPARNRRRSSDDGEGSSGRRRGRGRRGSGSPGGGMDSGSSPEGAGGGGGASLRAAKRRGGGAGNPVYGRPVGGEGQQQQRVSPARLGVDALYAAAGSGGGGGGGSPSVAAGRGGEADEDGELAAATPRPAPSSPLDFGDLSPMHHGYDHVARQQAAERAARDAAAVAAAGGGGREGGGGGYRTHHLTHPPPNASAPPAPPSPPSPRVTMESVLRRYAKGLRLVFLHNAVLMPVEELAASGLGRTAYASARDAEYGGGAPTAPGMGKLEFLKACRALDFFSGARENAPEQASGGAPHPLGHLVTRAEASSLFRSLCLTKRVSLWNEAIFIEAVARLAIEGVSKLVPSLEAALGQRGGGGGGGSDSSSVAPLVDAPTMVDVVFSRMGLADVQGLHARLRVAAARVGPVSLIPDPPLLAGEVDACLRYLLLPSRGDTAGELGSLGGLEDAASAFPPSSPGGFRWAGSSSGGGGSSEDGGGSSPPSPGPSPDDAFRRSGYGGNAWGSSSGVALTAYSPAPAPAPALAPRPLLLPLSPLASPAAVAAAPPRRLPTLHHQQPPSGVALPQAQQQFAPPPLPFSPPFSLAGYGLHPHPPLQDGYGGSPVYASPLGHPLLQAQPPGGGGFYSPGAPFYHPVAQPQPYPALPFGSPGWSPQPLHHQHQQLQAQAARSLPPLPFASPPEQQLPPPYPPLAPLPFSPPPAPMASPLPLQSMAQQQRGVGGARSSGPQLLPLSPPPPAAGKGRRAAPLAAAAAVSSLPASPAGFASPPPEPPLSPPPLRGRLAPANAGTKRAPLLDAATSPLSPLRRGGRGASSSPRGGDDNAAAAPGAGGSSSSPTMRRHLADLQRLDAELAREQQAATAAVVGGLRRAAGGGTQAAGGAAARNGASPRRR